jgi:phage terminase large subunit GpA-like protein
MGLASAHDVMYAAFKRTVAPRRKSLVSAWATEHRRLSPKGSAEPFPWNNMRNPLQVEIMDCGSASWAVTDMVAILPIQFGKSEIEANILGYTITENPMPIIVALPGEVSMNKFIDQKLNPLIDETEAIQKALVSLNTRESSNRRTFKDFEGGQLYIEHAGDAKRLKSTSAGLVLGDEFSSFANELRSGDDPVALLDGRTTAFTRAKRIKVGTPETEGNCRLSDAWEVSDQRKFHIECPDCKHTQPMEWSGLQWTPDANECWYACRACEFKIEEYQKTELIADAFRRNRAGEQGIGWVPKFPERKARGYRANGLYYPAGLGLTWLGMIREFLAALNDPAALKTFLNDRLAETWKSKATPKEAELRDRTEPYRLRTAPHGVLAVTAGVDTQDNRLAVVILGWGRGLTCWVLDYIELPGDPAEPQVWTALTDLLNRPVQHASGAMLRVEAVAIDAGGHRTEDVKHFARQRRVRRPMAIFGSRSANAPVLGRPVWQDVNWQGKVDKKGVQTYQVGGIEITHRLYAWLGADTEKEPDKRRIHLSAELDDAFLGGLVSEVWNPRKGRYDHRKGAPRNEPLDTVKYAYAAAHHHELRLHRHTAADWDAREKRLRESADPLAVPAMDSRETSEPVAGADVPPPEHAGTNVPRESNAPAPVSAVGLRTIVFELVGKAERDRGQPATDAQLARWHAAVPANADERGLQHELLSALELAHAVPSMLPDDLLDKAKRFLSGLPVAHTGPRKRGRGVRSRGLH